MGATWIFIISILHIGALSKGKATVVMGVEGQSLSFRCEYPVSQRSNAKYFCHAAMMNSVSCTHLIKTVKHDQWVRDGRFSLYDNSTGGVFIVRVDGLTLGDSGKYWCGVDISLYPDTMSEIQLNISPAPTTVILQEDHTHETTVTATMTAMLPEELIHNATVAATSPEGPVYNKSHLPLVLTAVTCVAALLFVCVFTLSLLLVVRHQNPSTRQNREISSDYVSMDHARGSHLSADYTAIAASLPPLPEYYGHVNSEHRVSAASLGLYEYADVDAQGQTCEYQHLDPNLSEEHVYHNLYPCNGLK